MAPYISTHKLSRQLPVPVAFFHPDKMSTPFPSQNLGGPTPFSRLSIWAYLAIAFVILVLAAVISYMIYGCYYTAGLRARLKAETATGAGGVKGGWQNLEDTSGETMVERGEGRLSKGLDVGEKVDVDYQDEHKTDAMIHPWSEKNRSGLKGLGIQLERKPQLDFSSQPNESQASILPGSPHSTFSLGSTSDHEHGQDIESSKGSDCPSMSAKPLAHTTERSATYHSFNVPPPLPIPLPLPVTPSPPTLEQQVKQKRTRIRALTQILAYNLMQNQNGRDTYFELQPMIKQAENGTGSQSKALLSGTPDESSPTSPLSSSQFAFFAPYPNCNSISTSNIDSNASNSWGNNISGATSTPITPLTPITPTTTSVCQTGDTFDPNSTSLPGHVPIPTLATLDEVLQEHANFRLGYLRRGVSLSSPPSPSPSSQYSGSSSDSVASSPSITTVRFTLDRGELKRDNLRNRDRDGLRKEKKENMKALSPIPRPVFVPHTQPSKFLSSEPF